MNKILIGSENRDLTKQVIDILCKDENINKENEVVIMGENMVNANILAMLNHKIQKNTKDELEKFVSDEGNKQRALSLAIILAEQHGEGKWIRTQKIYKNSKWGFEETKENIQYLEAFGFIVRDEQYENNIQIIIDPNSKLRYLQKQYLKAKMVSDQLGKDIKEYKDKNIDNINKSKIMSDDDLGLRPIIKLPENLKTDVKDQDELLKILNIIKDHNSDFSFIFV